MSTRPVRFGVTLPQIKRSWPEARAAAVEFDRLGFDSVWVCDHLYSVPMPTLPIFEAWSQLAAVAASPSGSFVIVWQSFAQDGEDYGIFAKRYSSAGAPLATMRKRFHTPFAQITFTKPVSSSRLRNTVPFAVDGCCRCVTTPATSTTVRSGMSRRSALVTTP